MKEQLYIDGKWTGDGPLVPITNKYTGETIGEVRQALTSEVEAAIIAADKASAEMAALPAFKRALLLAKASASLESQRDAIAKLIAMEAGKAIQFARIEVDRAVGTLQLASEEAKRIHGETVPLDATAAGQDFFGYWTRRPIGVVAAITPFNFPLNLVRP